MITKLSLRKYFLIIFLAFLIGCSPAQPNISEIQTQAVVMAKTSIALTQTALPTITLTATFVYPTSSPIPTQPPAPILTPDVIQVERWEEYQLELAKAVIASNPESEKGPAVYKEALCEWDILGQSGQEIYVYAVCASFNYHAGMRNLAIIYIEPDGSVHNVKVPEIKANSRMHDYDPFPVDVQNKFCYYFSPTDLPTSVDRPPCPYEPTDRRPRLDAMYAHLEHRRYHPEEPPLVVLLALPANTLAATFVYPTSSPIPTQPPAPILTPDVNQVERWEEYQLELAKAVIASNPESEKGPAVYKEALCEWDILGQSGQEIYVYAVCTSFNYHAGMRAPAIIYIESDGSIRNVTVPGYRGANYDLDLFPIEVQEKLCGYIFYQCNESMGSQLRLDALHTHLEYRRYHPEEPPLIVLLALPANTLAATFMYPTSSPIPTQPPAPIFTPDAVQVTRWKEYQTELAKALFVFNPSFPEWRYGPDIYRDAICEWDILGSSGQEVYVLAVCLSADGLSSRDNPAVIYLKSDGSIQEVVVSNGKIDPPGGPYITYNLQLFPMDIQEKLCVFYFYYEVHQCRDLLPAYPGIYEYSQSRQSVLMSHLEYRRKHPDEPPLVVLSSVLTATPRP